MVYLNNNNKNSNNNNNNNNNNNSNSPSHDKRVRNELEKIVNEESEKLQMMRLKLDEEARRKNTFL